MLGSQTALGLAQELAQSVKLHMEDKATVVPDLSRTCAANVAVASRCCAAICSTVGMTVFIFFSMSRRPVQMPSRRHTSQTLGV